MPAPDAIQAGERAFTICNACRYCEQYCPVFPAMERRLSFADADLAYLANLCHNCGECLYACPYAPPHEFGINLPRTLSTIRLQSYEDACWPRFMMTAFRSHGVATTTGLAAAMSAVILVLASWLAEDPVWPTRPGADFYRVIPHRVMVAVFGAVSVLVAGMLTAGMLRFWRRINLGATAPRARARQMMRALYDAMTLKHLHGTGVDCVDGEESRPRWRRWFHHATVYGFLLCFASTSVAALYHQVLGWRAPYAYDSVPVVLGTLGGIGLLIGPLGLLFQRRRRDPALSDADQRGLDAGFLWMLLVTGVTGLLLLAFRDRAAMGILLIVHLGSVLALFLTLPYGKFVHGIYRTAALIKDAGEHAAGRV